MLEPPFVLLSLLLELIAVAAGAADDVEAFEAEFVAVPPVQPFANNYCNCLRNTPL
jgi:hypothetical protein